MAFAQTPSGPWCLTQGGLSSAQLGSWLQTPRVKDEKDILPIYCPIALCEVSAMASRFTFLGPGLMCPVGPSRDALRRVSGGQCRDLAKLCSL